MRLSAICFRLVMTVLLTVGLLPLSTPETIAQTPDSVFGVNGHVATRYGIYQRQQVPLDVMVNHNVSWNREEFRWDAIQPSPGRWDWGFTDEMVDKATQRGINILGLLAYSVGWASPSAGVGSNQPAFAPPENLDAYRVYVRTVVNRYRGRVRAWEIWNEPNHNIFWRPQANPQQYGQLVLIASQAIREADPRARVVLGGISGSDVAFLEQVVAVTGWGAFDIVAAHPYVAPKSPERGHLASGELAKLQAFVDRHGGKPIWLTEVGWPSSVVGRWGVGDWGTQANYLVRGMVQAAAHPHVERIFWYNWRNDGGDPGNDEHNFGMVGYDWRTPKAAATAYRTMTLRLDGATAPRQLDLAGGNRTTLIDFESDTSWHVWGDGATATVERAGEQHHGGGASGKISYGFHNGGKAYVDLQHIRDAPGQPQRLALWVHGNRSGHLLWATFRDAHNEWFRLYLGAIGSGWQLRQAELNAFETSDGGDGVIQYPIRFQSLIIDNEPDGWTGTGTLFVDDLYVEEGPAIYGYRFDRAGGHVDVLWALGGANLTLPTASGSARVTNRDGQTQTIAAANGGLSLTLNDSPIFVEHTGREVAAPPPAPPVEGDDAIAGSSFADPAFSRVWSQTDRPVTERLASRTWYWGPGPWLTRTEPYAQSPDGRRRVQYFDKSRMEITQPGGDPGNPWFVTNGLLVKEMVTGQIQVGDGQSIARAPADLPVAGDLVNNDPAPTYASFERLIEQRAANRTGQRVDQSLARNGRVSASPRGLSGPPVEFVIYDDRLGHNIPRVFWDFLNQSGPIYRDNQLQHSQLVDWLFAFGLPISEPYWTRVRIGGEEREVLVQLYERRVLTYTPSNPPGWQVEMGNVGQHYYQWRYGTTPWGRS